MIADLEISFHYSLSLVELGDMQAAKHERSQDSQEDLLPSSQTAPRRWLPWAGALSWMALIGSTSLVLPQYLPVTQAEALLLSIGSAIFCNLLVLQAQV